MGYISHWNKRQVLHYFSNFLDMCYRKERVNVELEDLRDFLNQSVQEIQNDLLEGEIRKPSTTGGKRSPNAICN